MESLVATSIFIGVTAVAVGAFAQALKTQRLLTEIMSAINNTTTALEQIAREVRTGYGFCSLRPDPLDACEEEGTSLSFKNYEGFSTTFSWDQNLGALVRDGVTPYPLTASNVVIEQAIFSVRQRYQQTLPPEDTSVTSPCAPWLVTLAVKARPKNSSVASRTFSVQSSVSVRTLPREAPDASNAILQYCDEIL